MSNDIKKFKPERLSSIMNKDEIPSWAHKAQKYIDYLELKVTDYSLPSSEFEVGQWVENIKTGSLHMITALSNFDDAGKLHDITDSDWMIEDFSLKYRLWTPKPGDKVLKKNGNGRFEFGTIGVEFNESSDNVVPYLGPDFLSVATA